MFFRPHLSDFGARVASADALSTARRDSFYASATKEV